MLGNLFKLIEIKLKNIEIIILAAELQVGIPAQSCGRNEGRGTSDSFGTVELS